MSFASTLKSFKIDWGRESPQNVATKDHTAIRYRLIGVPDDWVVHTGSMWKIETRANLGPYRTHEERALYRPDISHWVPICVSSLFGLGFTAVFISCYRYLMTCCGIWSTSALATVNFLRSMLSGGMVMASTPMYKTIGVIWSLTIIAIVAAVMAPVPLSPATDAEISDNFFEMASTPLWPALAAVVLLLFSVASAQVCLLNPYYYYVDDPEQVEELSRNCTVLHGWVYVQDNFTGSFNLPRVTNITGVLSVGNDFPSGLTDVQLPDLEYVRDFRLSGVKNASLPRLIDNRASSEYLLRNLTATVVDISFPVVERVGAIHLLGNISSFSAPELTTIATSTDFSSAMIWFEPFEPGLSVDLPKLAFVNGSVEFVGVVNNVSLPMLRNVTGDFKIETWSTESIATDLAIEYTDEVELRGNIDRVALPNLRNYSRIRVYPDDAFDCDGLAEQLNGTVTPPVIRRENFFCSGAETLSSRWGTVVGAAVSLGLLNIMM
ncbi:hypothetical protein N7475_007217 [Penicillium sp. IBT 31633x]|nr:hypothetical protein N7475_007217 [Penicillium sp. IBT 31633x]